MARMYRCTSLIIASLLLGCSINGVVSTRTPGGAGKTAANKAAPTVAGTPPASGGTPAGNAGSTGGASTSNNAATLAGQLKLPPGALTRAVPQTGDTASLVGKAKLVGKVKLLSDQAGSIISNNSGTLLSDQAGSIISDQGGSLIANNGANLIANNGAGFAPRFALAQAQKVATESLLADAGILLQDAAGRILVDENNRPLGAVTDRQGNYTLNAALPNENLVLRVPLWQGGELLAIATRKDSDVRELPIDTASSLGAAYVLEQFVKGQQEVFNKLPTSEAEKLRSTIESARGFIDKPPAYQASELVQLTTALREKAPAVNETLETIRALLLGQANLGSGLMALEVPLSGPAAVCDDGEGGFFITEGTLGRIRRVSADGRISTWADKVQGQIKANFFAAVDMARGPDGAVYVTGFNDGIGVIRIAPDGSFARVAGTQLGGRGELGKPGNETAIHPFTLWVDPQNQLWIGEEGKDDIVRILKLLPNGTLQEAGTPSNTWRDAYVTGLCAGDNGSVLASLRIKGNTTEVWRLPATGGAWTKLYAPGEGGSRWSDLVNGPDGSVYLSLPDLGRIVRIMSNGTAQPVYQALESSELREPRDLQALPNGRLRVVSSSDNRIYEVDPKSGQAKVVAGLLSGKGSGDQIPINSPFALALNEKGILHMIEAATSLIRAWDGKEVTTVVGSETGYAGDGGPADQAHLNKPTGLAFLQGSLFILDQLNSVMREVKPDNTIHTVIRGAKTPIIENGAPVEATNYDTKGTIALIKGPDEALYWSSLETNQVVRYAPGGRISLVAGRGGKGADTGDDVLPEEARLKSPFSLAFSPAGELFISDTGNMLIRRITQGDGGKKLSTFAGLGLLGTFTTFNARDFSTGARAATSIPILLPGPLCFDAQGNLYVGELGTSNLPLLAGLSKGLQDMDFAALPPAPARILKITPEGATTILAGPGGAFFADPEAGDALVLPTSLVVDAQGRLIISDAGANLVRILPAGSF
jgi:hypothetical protein